MEEKMKALKEQIKKIKLQDVIFRILTAFFVVSFFRTAMSKSLFLSKSFYSEFSFPLHMLSIACLFVLFCFIKNQKVIKILMIGFATSYFFLSAFLVSDYYFSIGLCFLLCVLIYFVGVEKLRPKMKKSLMWGLSVGVGVLFIAFVSLICCLSYKNYGTTCYDFGIFSQMFYYMKETGNCLTTCERDELLSHFAVHFSPIYYLLLPFYMIFPSPCTLLFLQAVVVLSGIIPIIYLCKHFKLSNAVSFCFAVCYAMYPAFLGGCFYFLHENCFLAPFILWLMYFMEKENVAGSFIFAILTMLIKEDAPVYVAVIALYFIFAKKHKKIGIGIFVFAIIYFVSVVEIMSLMGEGVMSDSRYGEYIYDDGGLLTVIKAVIQNPLYVVKQIVKVEKLLFIAEMMMPLCFLPLLMKRPEKLILLIPFILVNLMTNYSYQSQLGYQYEFGTGAILFFLAISNYSELGKKRNTIMLCSVLCSAILFAGGYMTKLSYIPFYMERKEYRETMDKALSMIPEDASVSSSTFMLPNISDREIIYELERTEHKFETDYVVVDATRNDDRVDIEDFKNSKYEEIFFDKNVVAIYKKVK